MQHSARMLGFVGSLGLCVAAAAQPEPLWIKQFGTVHDEDISALATDGAGGVFVAGSTEGSLFGPSEGEDDIIVARYDGAGYRMWSRQFGTTASDHALACAPDGTGGAFLAGYTWGDLAGPNEGVQDVFIARYDASGNEEWVEQFGTAGEDAALALAPDGLGGLFVAGITTGDLDGPGAGERDIFVARCDGAGIRLWIIQAGTPAMDHAWSLAPDGAGGVFVGGSTEGDLGGSNAGGWDAFIARGDGQGGLTWITQFGTDADDNAFGVAADGVGGAFVAGATAGSLGGPNSGERDGFLARHDGSGEQTWIKQFGTSGDDGALALSHDDVGGVLVGGATRGDLVGPNAGESDVFLTRHDGAGNLDWGSQFGTIKDDVASALAPDDAGGVFAAGISDGDFGEPGAGGADAFVARVAPLCYADCDGSGGLDLFDFLCYVNLFNDGEASADCDGNGGLDLFDFLCFVNLFNAGC